MGKHNESPKEVKNKRITVRLTNEFAEFLEQVAIYEDMTKSELIRQWCMALLDGVTDVQKIIAKYKNAKPRDYRIEMETIKTMNEERERKAKDPRSAAK